MVFQVLLFLIFVFFASIIFVKIFIKEKQKKRALFLLLTGTLSLLALCCMAFIAYCDFSRYTLESESFYIVSAICDAQDIYKKGHGTYADSLTELNLSIPNCKPTGPASCMYNSRELKLTTDRYFSDAKVEESIFNPCIYIRVWHSDRKMEILPCDKVGNVSNRHPKK